MLIGFRPCILTGRKLRKADGTGRSLSKLSMLGNNLARRTGVLLNLIHHVQCRVRVFMGLLFIYYSVDTPG